MVDVRPVGVGAGVGSGVGAQVGSGGGVGAPHDHSHQAPNGAPPQENNHHSINNQSGGGDMVATSPAGRASTPATTAIPTYAGGVAMNNMSSMSPLPTCGYYYGPGLAPMPPGLAPPLGGGGKVGGGVVWMPPPVPPPPPHVNLHVYKSMQPNGADLPMNDIPTLRYYFNLGVDFMWASYGPPPPRPYPPRDLAQDMQQLSVQDRGNNHGDMAHKHKPGDKPPQNQNKGNGQRSLLGPRFNKRGNQDGNPNMNHNQNKGHNNNNNVANKGPNRRNSAESRGNGGWSGAGAGAPYEECGGEGGLVSVPYIYPPPVYPVHYYPVDSDPAMLGMMPGMTYMNYEENPEFMPYYPPVYPPAPPPAPGAHPPPPHVPMHQHVPHMHHQEHK